MNATPTYKPRVGESVTETARQMAVLATMTGVVVSAKFNGIELTAVPGQDPATVVAFYFEEYQRRHDAYVNSLEYKRREQERQESEIRRAAALKGALAAAPERMMLRDPEAWAKSVKVNADGSYGQAVMMYAERWARLMEARISNGDTLEACADDASHLANSEGITGFQYGCAVSILSQVWQHGEALRRWHNLKTQIGHEGERANETGGVLNPALLSIGNPAEH